MPGVTIAGGNSLRASGAVVEGQIERVNIGTAGARLTVVESVNT